MRIDCCSSGLRLSSGPRPKARTLVVSRALALCFATVLMMSESGAASAQCRQKFSFRASPRLDLTAVQRLAHKRASPATADGSSLVVWAFDAEDRPSYGRWIGLALVYITRGDIGEQPVGGLLLNLRRRP